jgi:probable rRNA maturation factor
VKSNIIFDNQTDLNLDLTLVQQIASELTSKEIELLIVNEQTIQTYNKRFRNIDKPTDVLSFPYENMPNAPLGSIVICDMFILNGAKKFNHSINDEFTLLFIHGLLHLLGYDHEVDNGQHRQKENELINQYNLPKSLIIRNF